MCICDLSESIDFTRYAYLHVYLRVCVCVLVFSVHAARVKLSRYAHCVLVLRILAQYMSIQTHI